MTDQTAAHHARIAAAPTLPDPARSAAQRGHRVGVLFVCLGNICRSPLAEAAFAHHAHDRGLDHRLDIDSAGIGNWHAGQPADPRTIAVGRRFGLRVTSVARQITPNDWTRFHIVLVMDRSNLSGVLRAGAPPERVRFLRAFDPALPPPADPERLTVPDPYQGHERDFLEVFAQVAAAAAALLHALAETMDLRTGS